MIQKNIYKSNYRYMVAFFVWCFLFLCSFNSYAQVKQSTFIDSIFNKIDRYGINYHTPEMFVHFDKTIYSTNENVWLTAYLLDTLKQAEQNTLIVSLVKDNDRKLVMQEKFVLHNGIAFGNLFLSDSLVTGNYTFVAYTNLIVNGKPWVIYKQSITIKTDAKPVFTALLSPIDTAASLPQRTVRLMANKSAVETLPNADISYYVGSPTKYLLAGKGKTDASGQYVFTIQSNLLTPGSNKLYVTVTDKDQVKELSITLPVNQKRILSVNFYPEGGNLVDKLLGYVGWEVKTEENLPLGVNAVIYKDGKATDSIETNGYGIGKFLLIPQYGSDYTVKIDGDSYSYKLPVVLAAGITVSAQKAVTNDTLSVVLHNSKPEKVFVLVHNYKQLFSAMPVSMNTNSKLVKILLGEVPKGVNQLTVTDSLGRPFAQRTFFAHYDQKQSLHIDAKEQYKPREKVDLKIKLNGLDTSSIGLVSIAVVQENRIESKKKNDIESYFYLKSQLGDLPVKNNYLNDNEVDKDFLENILLIKGWSRYKWTDVLSNDINLATKLDPMVFSGLVTSYTGKYLKKPVDVVLMKREEIKPMKTDSAGFFILNYEDMVTMQGKKIGLMVTGDNAQDKYKLNLTDPYIKVSQGLPTKLSYTDYSSTLQQNTANLQLPNIKGTLLSEVTINGKNDNSFKGNECGDYVCMFNILNCPNHRTDHRNKAPVKGEVYTYNRSLLVYQGCGSGSNNFFRGIYNAMEFYPADYEKDSPPLPEYLSTIYWKHLTKVSAAKKTEFSFYTSDITGRFKIIIQGITDNDVVYAEKTFNVVKAK
jgi:hypothetical protein